MKAVMIVYNQSHTNPVQEALDKCNIRGFTRWPEVQGRGSHKGEPHYGTHAWPSMNTAILAIVELEKMSILLKELNAINDAAEQQGLRVFVWEAESVI